MTSFTEQKHIDLGLMFLRLTGAFMLFYVHGLPKVLDYELELTRIEDPLGLGSQFSLWGAIFAEVVCPVFIAVGLFVRLAALPIIGVLLIAMVLVHSSWSVAEGQFGWLLLIIFTTIAITGPGQYRLQTTRRNSLSRAQ